MENKIKVMIEGEQLYEVSQGTPVTELLELRAKEDAIPIVAAYIDNELKDLRTPLMKDCQVRLVDIGMRAGLKVYRRSATIVLLRAIAEVLPGSKTIIQHTLSNGRYGEVEDKILKEKDIARIERQMKYIIDADEPMELIKVKKDEAERLLIEASQRDKLPLLKYEPKEELELYSCGGYYDFSHGPMVPSTGCLHIFRLRFYLPGFILELPSLKSPTAVPPYVEQGKIANIHYEAKKWANIINVNNVVSLNDLIIKGQAGKLIRIAEAFHEKKIAQIADTITENIDLVRIVLIAGPTSSGKTTFAQRLSTQLQVNGIRPIAISQDDYFVDREKTPLDEHGNPDFESVYAVDIELFNDHLIRLIQGEEIELPYFNFTKGIREFHGERLRLGPADLLLVEGIHGLNDILTRSIPMGRKFKIYISALTQINLDNENRIPTTDVRLIRRIIRDQRCRGRSAKETISMWLSVNRGEEKNIFSFQESADIMFNSALPYELAVLKEIVEPFLKEITQADREYAEAQRLLHLISYFLPLELEDIPLNSIVREFIGDSCFSGAVR